MQPKLGGSLQSKTGRSLQSKTGGSLQLTGFLYEIRISACKAGLSCFYESHKHYLWSRIYTTLEVQATDVISQVTNWISYDPVNSAQQKIYEISFNLFIWLIPSGNWIVEYDLTFLKKIFPRATASSMYKSPCWDSEKFSSMDDQVKWVIQKMPRSWDQVALGCWRYRKRSWM